MLLVLTNCVTGWGTTSHELKMPDEMLPIKKSLKGKLSIPDYKEKRVYSFCNSKKVQQFRESLVCVWFLSSRSVETHVVG